MDESSDRVRMPPPDPRRRLRSVRLAGSGMLLCMLMLPATGCIIVPVPSLSPDYETGIIDESRLEELEGLHRDAVIEKLGWPDFIGPSGDARVMVYEGEKRYTTDVHAVVSAGYTATSVKIGDGLTTVLYCQTLDLDENGRVKEYDVTAYPTTGITKKDAPGASLPPVADCADVLWKADERQHVLTKPEYLATRAQAGERKAAMVLASQFDDLTYLKTLARGGDLEASLKLARDHDVVMGLRPLAEAGDREAAEELLELTGETTAELHAAAEGGDREAATLIARYTNDLGLLRSMAEKGDYQAAEILAEEFADETYVAKAVESGNYIAAYQRYQHLRGKKATHLAAWRWLCVAANLGYSRAQAEVGQWHRRGSWESWQGWYQEGVERLREAGVRPDDTLSYMWYTLAVQNGDQSALDAREHYLAGVLTPDQMEAAKQMARAWQPGDCPNAAHRLRPPQAGPGS